MGGVWGKDYIHENTVKDLEKCLFLQRDEINKAYVMFTRLSNASTAEMVKNAVHGPLTDPPPKERFPHDPCVWEENVKLLRIEQFLCLDAFKNNIIAPRIFEVFSDSAEGMSFNAFLYLVSSFSYQAPLPVKTYVALSVFSFHSDGTLCMDDVELLIKLYSREMSLWGKDTTPHAVAPFPFHNPGEKVEAQVVPWEDPYPACPALEAADPCDAVPRAIAEKLFNAIDINGNGELSRDEFEGFLMQIPDFRSKFSIDILA